MFQSDGLHVLEVQRGHAKLVATVETDADVAGCDVLASPHGRRPVRLTDAPCFGTAVTVIWRKRVWRCAEPACGVRTWTETYDLAGPCAVLTSRAIGWAVDALAHDDTTVSALARHLGVDWHTLWNAVRGEAERRVADPARRTGVKTLGVDEHIWRPSGCGHLTWPHLAPESSGRVNLSWPRCAGSTRPR